MQKFAGLFIIISFLTSCSHTYYIVRHAEKSLTPAGGAMSTPDDPALSDAGTKRAEGLKEVLKDKNVRNIFSTNTKRTRLTAEPLSNYSGLSIQTYGPRPDSIFINQLKKLKRNTLIIGHSNTVDDLVNGLSHENKLSDLTDSEYDNLFIVQYKRFLEQKLNMRERSINKKVVVLLVTRYLTMAFYINLK